MYFHELLWDCGLDDKAVKCLLGQTTLDSLHLLPDLMWNRPVMDLKLCLHAFLLVDGVVLPNVHLTWWATTNMKTPAFALLLDVLGVIPGTSKCYTLFSSQIRHVTHLHTVHQRPLKHVSWLLDIYPLRKYEVDVARWFLMGVKLILDLSTVTVLQIILIVLGTQ